MTNNPSDAFTTTTSKKDIHNYIDESVGNKGNLVKKVQNIKETIAASIYTDFSHNGQKLIDPNIIKGVEKEYLKLIQRNDYHIDPKFDYEQYSQEMKNMFVAENFPNNYVGDFGSLRNNSLIETPKHKLITRKKVLEGYNHLGPKDKEELNTLNKIITLLDTNTIKNTKSRTIFFANKELNPAQNTFNAQCFFEKDSNGHTHYFSFNELLNDLETFGSESGYPVLDVASVQIPGIPNPQKHIKLALIKNILAKYRDYQEVIMYDFKDYEKHIQANPFSNYSNQKGLLAEKIVEWHFRNFAYAENRYAIKVKKASIGEDQKNKIDLFVEVKDKTSGVNITKELQLTLDNNPSVLAHKKQQIAREKTSRDANLDLLQLELSLLDQKMTLWRNMHRPIGGISDLLSIEDKEFLKTTFEKIIKDIQKKEDTKETK